MRNFYDVYANDEYIRNRFTKSFYNGHDIYRIETEYFHKEPFIERAIFRCSFAHFRSLMQISYVSSLMHSSLPIESGEFGLYSEVVFCSGFLSFFFFLVCSGFLKEWGIVRFLLVHCMLFVNFIKLTLYLVFKCDSWIPISNSLV